MTAKQAFDAVMNEGSLIRHRSWHPVNSQVLTHDLSIPWNGDHVEWFMSFEHIENMPDLIHDKNDDWMLFNPINILTLN